MKIATLKSTFLPTLLAMGMVTLLAQPAQVEAGNISFEIFRSVPSGPYNPHCNAPSHYKSPSYRTVPVRYGHSSHSSHSSHRGHRTSAHGNCGKCGFAYQRVWIADCYQNRTQRVCVTKGYYKTVCIPAQYRTYCDPHGHHRRMLVAPARHVRQYVQPVYRTHTVRVRVPGYYKTVTTHTCRSSHSGHSRHVSHGNSHTSARISYRR
jgi:hypothetical protein